MKIDKYVFEKLRLYLAIKRGVEFVKINRGPLKGYLWTPTTDFYRYCLGIHEVHLSTSLVSNLKSDSVFYDLGANAGYYSLIASTKIDEGAIYGFEPVDKSIKYFRAHLVKNQITNVEIISKGISDSCKEIYFTATDHISGNGYKNIQDEPKDLLKVDCLSIDSFVEEYRAKPPTIIKIDIEGAELDALKGSENTLKEFRPLIYLATHDDIVPNITRECIEFLERLGYTVNQSGDEKDSKGQFDFICKYEG